jgi:hypothetical protein
MLLERWNMVPDRDDATKCRPALSRPPRPWQFSLLEAGIVITALCVWLGVWHLAGRTWGLITIALSGPVVGLGLMDYGLRTRRPAALWLGGALLAMWPVILIMLTAMIFMRR